MSNEFDFGDLTIIEIPVTGPDKKHYLLREANGRAAKIFNNARIRGVTLGEEGKPKTISDVGELESLLVSLCLFGANNEDDLTVGYDRAMHEHRTYIEKWPERVLKPLYNKAREISDLDETENPLKVALETALQRADTPVALDTFRKFVSTLPDDKTTGPLRKLLKEDSAKNLPKSTMDG